MNEDKRLDDALDRWDSGFTPDSDLLKNLRSRIERARVDELHAATAESLGDWMRLFFGRPAFALGYAAVFVLVGVGASSLLQHGFKEQPEEMTLSYRLSIDPLYRLETVAGPQRSNLEAGGERKQVMLNGLGWLQGELDLSRPQFERVSSLHTDYGKRFDEIFMSLLTSHAQYRELDKKRMSNDVIDYFQIYELLQTQKRLSEASSSLTAELLEKVSEIITPGQRERYEELLRSLYPDMHSSEEVAGSSTNA